MHLGKTHSCVEMYRLVLFDAPSAGFLSHGQKRPSTFKAGLLVIEGKVLKAEIGQYNFFSPRLVQSLLVLYVTLIVFGTSKFPFIKLENRFSHSVNCDG